MPLRRVGISAPRPKDLEAIGPIRFTPTFILLHKGRELGRIVGYSGEEFFWGYLEEMAERIPRPKKNAGSGSEGIRK